MRFINAELGTPAFCISVYWDLLVGCQNQLEASCNFCYVLFIRRFDYVSIN